MTTTVTLNVPTLTDNTTAFANAAAWSNYWSGVQADVTFDAVAVDAYTTSSYNTALPPSQITIDTDTHVLVNKAMFDSLRAMVETLDVNYKAMRASLRTAGLINY